MYDIDFNVSVQKLKQQLHKLHPSDVAELFEDNEAFRDKIYVTMGVKSFKNVFVLLEESLQVTFFNSLTKEQQKSLLVFLDTEDIKTLLDAFDLVKQLYIISLLPQKTQKEIAQLISYEVDSSGALSSPHYVSLSLDMTVKEATHYVTTDVSEKDEIDVIFFHDSDGKYQGAISLQALIIARANQSLVKLIDDQYPFVYTDEPIETAIQKIRDYDIEMIAVLDRDDKQVGVILSDDALTIMDELHVETMSQLFKAQTISDQDSPLKRSLNRLPWLLVCGLLNILIVSFLSGFSGVLETHVALILFQPMILLMAGNIGTQSISVIILKLQKQPTVYKKDIAFEFSIGLLNGLISAAFGAVIVFIFLNVLPNTYNDIPLVALAVGLSIFVSMVLSALFGVLTPLILRKFGADEKAASGPLITTINDLFALGTYFLIATLILL